MCVYTNVCAKWGPGASSRRARGGWVFLCENWGLQKIGSLSNKIHGDLEEGPPEQQWALPYPWCQSLWARGPPGRLCPSSTPCPAHPKPGKRGGLEARTSPRAGRKQQGRCCHPPDEDDSFHLYFHQAWPRAPLALGPWLPSPEPGLLELIIQLAD